MRTLDNAWNAQDWETFEKRRFRGHSGRIAMEVGSRSRRWQFARYCESMAPSALLRWGISHPGATEPLAGRMPAGTSGYSEDMAFTHRRALIQKTISTNYEFSPATGEWTWVGGTEGRVDLPRFSQPVVAGVSRFRISGNISHSWRWPRCRRSFSTRQSADPISLQSCSAPP